MIILCLVGIAIFCILVQLILYLLVQKYGKISYDGFSAMGFAYNSEKDIFYSTKNAWQKNFGYTHAYDVFAPICQMIIDTEPVKFFYGGKNWLITFWKGQYGIVTGAEVGVYCTEQERVNKKTVYMPSREMLDIYLEFYKKGKLISRICAKHWWLAIFKLGMFSNPKELSMMINIAFPSQEMLDAFLMSFLKLGHSKDDFCICGNTFCFRYTKPHTRKVWTRTWLTDRIRQFFNRKNVKLYNKYLGSYIDDDRIDDSKIENHKKLIMVNELIPDLLKNKSKEEATSREIASKLFNDETQNIAFLDCDFHCKVGMDEV